MRKGKIVYVPAEKCYTNVNIEKTEHGYKFIGWVVTSRSPLFRMEQ